MKLSNALVSALVVGTAATLGMSAAQAQASPLSDILSVTDPFGTTTTLTAAEGAGEPGLVYHPILPLDPLHMDIPALLSVGAHFVLLTEAPGTVPDPGEIIVPVPCPGQPGQPDPIGQCLLSDVVVGLLDATGAHVGLFSDPHPVFFDPSLPLLFPVATYVGETGAMQDLTAELGFVGTGYTVGVFSDGEVVPLPAAAWLFASAAGLLGLARRKINR